ncbi:MAG: hypothetical protein KAS23_14890 [Anaerohalosphaera sp.]|nr:hypothetical protein [Anaerohalosphaera sp.]
MIEEKQLGQLWKNLAFTKLFKAFKMAARPGKLVIGMVAIALACVIGQTMDVISASVITGTSISPNSRQVVTTTELQCYITEPETTDNFISMYFETGKRKGVFNTLWRFCAERFNMAFVPLLKFDESNIFANIRNAFDNIGQCIRAFIWAFSYHTVYSIVFFILVFPIVCISGGAICRCAALEFARGEKAGIVEALSFGAKRFKSFLAAPALSVLLLVTFCGMISLLGLAGNIRLFGEFAIGLLLPVALVFGVLAVLMAIGIVGGSGMMWPCVAYEGSSGFDAVSRSFMYVFTQPLWVLVYSFIATVYGTLSYLVVRFFTFLLLLVTYNLIEFGLFNGTGGEAKLARIWSHPSFFNLMGNTNATRASWTESVSSVIVNLWIIALIWLVVSFIISFYFCVNTVIYSILRSTVDGTEPEDVYLQLNEINSCDE